MFVFATKNTYLLWTFAIIILHVAIVSMQLTDSREIWLELLIRKKSKAVLKHSADMSVVFDSISTKFIIYVFRINDLTDSHGAVHFYVDTVIVKPYFSENLKLYKVSFPRDQLWYRGKETLFRYRKGIA